MDIQKERERLQKDIKRGKTQLFICKNKDVGMKIKRCTLCGNTHYEGDACLSARKR